MPGENILIRADTEQEVLAKIEQVPDKFTRNAILSLFWWKLAQTAAVSPSTNKPSS